MSARSSRSVHIIPSLLSSARPRGPTWRRNISSDARASSSTARRHTRRGLKRVILHWGRVAESLSRFFFFFLIWQNWMQLQPKVVMAFCWLNSNWKQTKIACDGAALVNFHFGYLLGVNKELNKEYSHTEDEGSGSALTSTHLSLFISHLAAFSQSVSQPPGTHPCDHSPEIWPSTAAQFRRSALTAFVFDCSQPIPPSVRFKQCSVRVFAQVVKGNRGDRRSCASTSTAETHQCKSKL